MSDDIKNGIVSVLNAQGQIVGTGFVAGPRLIVTCAHVVAQAGSGPGQTITLSFHQSFARKVVWVRAEWWSEAEALDVAGLELDAGADLPAGVMPLPVGDSAGSADHAFTVFGYAPFGELAGLWAKGQIQGEVMERDGRPLLQLDSQNLAPGMSGAPVWDDVKRAVVGMVTAGSSPNKVTHKHRDLALATPAETLRAVCSILQSSTPLPSSNPFIAGGAVPPELFVGRASTLEFIKSRLGGRSVQSVSIVGERRMGKSSLLRYVKETSKIFKISEVFARPVIIYLDLMKGYCHTRAGFTKALRRELTTALGREPWPDKEDGDLATLSFAFEDLSQAGTRVVLCLDEMEELTKRRAEFDDLLEELRAAGQMGQLGLLTASHLPLADLCQSGGLISPFYNIFLQDTLGLLDDSDWRALVQKHLPVSEADFQAIERLAGRHPFYTQVAASRLWDAKQGGEAEWVRLTLEDMKPQWRGQWEDLSPAEQIVLRDASGFAGLVPDKRLVEALRRRGLLRPGSYRPFSDAYGDWLLAGNG